MITNVATSAAAHLASNKRAHQVIAIVCITRSDRTGEVVWFDREVSAPADIDAYRHRSALEAGILTGLAAIGFNDAYFYKVRGDADTMSYEQYLDAVQAVTLLALTGWQKSEFMSPPLVSTLPEHDAWLRQQGGYPARFGLRNQELP